MHPSSAGHVRLAGLALTVVSELAGYGLRVSFTFHHITLRVSDLRRARMFYEGVLGLTVDQDFPEEKLRFRLGGTSTRLVLVPPLAGTPAGDRFTERRIGLDHVAIGVAAGEVARLAAVLADAGVPNSGIKADPLGPAMITFRDPDNVQWEFFEEA